jgi:saccharopine dehydrogenase-like NADP-dependent oxidoreductase
MKIHLEPEKPLPKSKKVYSLANPEQHYLCEYFDDAFALDSTFFVSAHFSLLF